MRRLAAACAFALLAAAAAGAAEETWRYEVYRDLMSPYCPGRTLDACPSPQAAELRQWIGAQEDAGRSRDEVEEQLVRIYGETMLSAPRAQGWGLTAYVIPVGAFAFGGALLWIFLRRQAAAAPAPAPGAGISLPIDPELERRVDQEIARS
jgi:cytochrome c-type biogenesis protein CcmH